MTPPAASATRARSATAVPAPLRLPPAPRRVSGPSRHPRAVEVPASGVVAGALLRLIDHPWLERLMRGRAWIAIVATALLGIVAMQVALLRLGAQIGGETASVNSMIQRNNTMKDTIAGLEASGDVSSYARSAGMAYPPPGTVTYLQANPGDAQRAVATMTSPSTTAIAAAAAHPPRSIAKSAVSTPSTHASGSTANPNTVSAGGATASTTTAATSSTAGTTPASATGTAVTAGTTSAGTQTTSGTAATTANTPAVSTTPSTTPSTTTAGGAAASTVGGGASAATTGAGSGASVAPSDTATGG